MRYIDEDWDIFPSSSVAMGDQFVISFSGLVKIAVDFGRRVIIPFDRSPNLTAADFHHFLFDHVAPRIIAGLEFVVLHGAAISINGKLAVLIGETGAGKSTLAASLKYQGYDLLGDDAVVVTERNGVFYGDAIYPSLRLFPESLKAIYAGTVETSEMAHYSDKLRVDLPQETAITGKCLPISAIFHVSKDGISDRAQSVKLTPLETCMKCTEQSFAIDPHDPYAAVQRLGRVSKLASLVPGFTLRYPRQFEFLSDVHKLIQNCMATPTARKSYSDQA